MRQQVPRHEWYVPARAGHRPRVVVEDDDPALAISSFSLLDRAGFDVLYCSGPECSPGECPLLRGQDCPLLAGADAVLHGLDPGLGIAAAIRRQHPGIAVIVEQRPEADGGPGEVPAGCIPISAACSVPGRIEALRRELATGRARLRRQG